MTWCVTKYVTKYVKVPAPRGRTKFLIIYSLTLPIALFPRPPLHPTTNPRSSKRLPHHFQDLASKGPGHRAGYVGRHSNSGGSGSPPPVPPPQTVPPCLSPLRGILWRERPQQTSSCDLISSFSLYAPFSRSENAIQRLTRAQFSSREPPCGANITYYPPLSPPTHPRPTTLRMARGAWGGNSPSIRPSTSPPSASMTIRRTA